MRRIAPPVWVLLFTSLFASPAWAQLCVRDADNPYIPDAGSNCVIGGFPFEGAAGLRDPATANSFSLSPPGARSLAMGGAFLGLADDATAAYTNPAGLTNLSVGGAEVAVEMRAAQFRSPFVNQGHYNTNPEFGTDPTGVGQDFDDSLELGNAKGDTSGLSFLSYGFVLPGGLTMALYRHEVGNFQSQFEAQGPFNDFACVGDPADPNAQVITAPDGRPAYDGKRECELYRVQPSQSGIGLEIVNYGVSAAYAFDVFQESSLSVGLGISYYEADFDRETATYDVCRFDLFDRNAMRDLVEPLDPNRDQPFPCTQNDARARLPGGLYGPPDFTPDNIQTLIIEEADDEAFGVNLGFLLKIGRERRFSVGGVFRQGTEFDTTQTGLLIDIDEFQRETLPGTLTVPDVFGLGVAYRSAEGKTKVSFDWNRIRYSQTLSDFVSALDSDERNDFDVDDVDQFHFGVESIVLVVESLFVGSARFGAWYEPNHTPRYIGDNPDVRALFGSPPDDEIHYSLGFGLVIREDYQLDVAANFSDDNDSTVSFSLVKFF